MSNIATNYELCNSSSLTVGKNYGSEEKLNTDNNTTIFDNQCENTQEQIESLKDEYDSAIEEQGILGKLWNGFKNLTGLGLGSDDVENKIEQYENGEITYEEALNSVENFKEKQKGAVNIIANTATGLATAGFAITTGGIGALAIGAAVGGLTKAGLKTLDRATNEVEGDALDAKEILKDSATGAVDGLVSAATAGMVKAPVFGQSIKEGIKQGAIQGVKAGAITGAATGAADYTIEAAVEDEVEFNFNDLITSTTQNAASGAVFGGIFGAVAGGISQKNINGKTRIIHDKNLGKSVDNAAQSKDYLDNFNSNNKNLAITDPDESARILKDLNDISKKSEKLAITYDSQINEATKQIHDAFSDTSEITAITARSKSQKSIFSKLAKKSITNNADLSTYDSCYDAIGDALGIRIQIKSLNTDETKNIVTEALKENGINASFDDFVRYLQNDKNIDDETKALFKNVSEEIIDTLKTKQMQNTVDQLAQGIKKGEINITEINNYGSELTSYFTDKQIAQLVDAYDYAISNKVFENDKAFKIVSEKQIFDTGNTDLVIDKTSKKAVVNTKYKSIDIEQKTNALKDSGYVSSQMNTKHKLADNTVANGELQIRGTKVNSFADVEHIPYDIRTGKINANDAKYSDIYSLIKNMSKDNYNKYNQYLSDTYKALRMQELGLLSNNAKLPDISSYMNNGELSQEALSKLDMQGLIKISKH